MRGIGFNPHWGHLNFSVIRDVLGEKLNYIKGKDMILSDLLSRQKHDDRNPHDVIPISFNMHNILQDRYYKLGLTDKY